MNKYFYESKSKKEIFLSLLNNNEEDVEEIHQLLTFTTDGAKEKHVPVVLFHDNEVIVKVGEIPHPMLKEHHIEFIVLITNKGKYVKYLDIDKPAEASFLIEKDESVIEVYEYCNLHGLFVNKIK